MTPHSAILVTGGRGLVGSALGALGARALGRDELDITDPDDVGWSLDRLRPGAVINAAAQARVDLAEAEPERTFAVNAAAPGLLARACAERGVRLVHISTDYVLDGPDEPGLRLGPERAPRPRSAYARSKLAGEEAVLAEGGTVVRVQWVYRPGASGFFTRCMEALARGETLRLVTDQVGCPTPTRVVAPALLAAARGEARGTFHLACAGEASAWEWVAAGAEALGLELRAEAVLREELGGAWRPARSCLDSTSFTAAFGVEPPSWRRALREALAASASIWSPAQARRGPR